MSVRKPTQRLLKDIRQLLGWLPERAIALVVISLAGS